MGFIKNFNHWPELFLGVLYFICLFGAYRPCSRFLHMRSEYFDVAVSLANVVVFILGDPEQQGILVEYVPPSP